MKRRRAETLAEFLVAMMVFAMIMAGVFEFVANHTSNAARIKNWDFFTFHTQKWLNEQENLKTALVVHNPVTISTDERGKITFWRDEDDTELMNVAHGSKIGNIPPDKEKPPVVFRIGNN